MRVRHSQQQLKYLLVSEEYEWSLQTFGNLSSSGEFDVEFVPSHNDSAVDMCILSRCAHVIITTGTYGWWAAYLSGGTVIYSANYCKRTHFTAFHSKFSTHASSNLITELMRNFQVHSRGSSQTIVETDPSAFE